MILFIPMRRISVYSFLCILNNYTEFILKALFSHCTEYVPSTYALIFGRMALGKFLEMTNRHSLYC